MNKKPYFSIIIPTYNRADFLQIAIASVLNQTFCDYELIVVDDGSTDDTSTRLKPIFNRQKNLKYFHFKHQGVSAARNYGLGKACGKYIAFLDSDDRFVKTKLEVFHREIEKNPKYPVFHSQEIWYRYGKILPQKSYHKKPSGDVFENVLKICSISISTAVIKDTIFKEIGLFDPNMPACEDYDFWLRIGAKHHVYLIDQYLTIKEGGHPDQQSKKYSGMDKFRIYAIEKLIKQASLNQNQKKIALDKLNNKCRIYAKGLIKRGKQTQANQYLNLAQRYLCQKN